MISFYLKQKKTLKPKTTLKIIQCKRNKIAVLSHPVVSDSLQPHGLSPPGSSVYGIFQARILEWVAISYSRGSSWARDQTTSLGSPALAGRFFTVSATYFKEIVSFISDGPVLYPRNKIYHIYISPWRRARKPPPVFLPGESHGWRSLARGCKELDTTEAHTYIYIFF